VDVKVERLRNLHDRLMKTAKHPAPDRLCGDLDQIAFAVDDHCFVVAVAGQPRPVRDPDAI
jgi:hypothetical protein